MRARAGLVALLVVVAGCGGAPVPRRAPEPGPPVWVAAECSPSQPLGTPARRGRVPDDFAAAWVLRCTQQIRGRENVLVAERAEESVAELAGLLREPSDPPTGDVCTADLRSPPYFLLVDADGRALLPHVPTDQCGQPRAEVVDLVEGLTYEPVAETPLGSVPPTEGEAGCPTAWKDEMAIDAGEPGPAVPLWPEPVDALRVCVYGGIAGEGVPAGTLETGRVVTGERSQALRDALAEAGPAGACTRAHTRFAVLHPEDRAAWATVELDGCLRVTRPDRTLGQAEELVTGLLTGP